MLKKLLSGWYWIMSWPAILETGIRSIFLKDIGFWMGIKIAYLYRNGIRGGMEFAGENARCIKDVYPLYRMFITEYITIANSGK